MLNRECEGKDENERCERKRGGKGLAFQTFGCFHGVQTGSFFSK